MKEFTSQTGGRYTYIDDLLNLQELSLAIVSIFDGCDNFIVSGCQVSGNTISSGYVFINGKIRYFTGAASVSKWPIYIYESNTVEKVPYADSGDKVGRNVYGCAAASSMPTNTDLLTGAVPQFVQINKDNTAMRLKDAFFGKYALTIDSSFNSQSVKKDVAFGGGLTVDGAIQSNTSLNVAKGNSKAIVSYDTNGDLVIQSTAIGRSAHRLIITNDGNFRFYSGDSLLATLSSKGFVGSSLIGFPQVNAGNIRCTDSGIYNYGSISDDGVLNINLVGYNGGITHYRNTVIGDGKGNGILEINGKSHQGKLYGDLLISSSVAALLKIRHSSLAKTDKTLQSYLNWQDKNGASIASLGYVSTEDFDFYVSNSIGAVRISSDTYIAGKLYVDGVDVMAIMTGKTDLADALKNKANVSDVYSKIDADKIFVKKTDGIGIFVTNAGGGETGKASVRNAIGAASTSDFNNAVQKSQLFKDIVSEGLPAVSDGNYTASLKARQKALCANIGAAFKEDVQTTQKDTGWIAMTVKNCGITTKLYVRQVGYVVSIQGELHTHHSGTIFTLPNNVDPPKYKIGYSHNKDGNWHCTMNGGSRDCVVDYCNNGCSEYIGFLMTYLV